LLRERFKVVYKDKKRAASVTWSHFSLTFGAFQ